MQTGMPFPSRYSSRALPSVSSARWTNVLGSSSTLAGRVKRNDYTMVAYVIADTQIIDRALGEQYRKLAQESIAKYGGRYIVLGGAEAVEGDWRPQLFVVVEFPSMARAHEWYRSREYAKALKLRQTALRRRLIFVEGVSPTQG